MKKPKRTKVLLAVALFLCLISAIGSRFIMTKNYNVKVYDVSIVTDYGVLTGQLYKPVTASSTAKRPAVVVSHGYLNSAEMQSANAIELSRRNYVVFAMNMYNHGSSYLFDYINDVVDNPFIPLFLANAYGMYDAVNYVYNLPYVDQTKIGVSGHSMGAMSANQAVYLDDMWVKSQADLGITVSPKISSVLLVGADANYTASLVLDSLNQPISSSYYGARHVGIVAGRYDEFFFRGTDYPAPRDFIKGANAKQFINSVNLDNPVGANESVVNALDDKVNGYYYGTVDYFGTTGTKQYMRVIYTPDEIHPWNHFSIASTGATIEFFFKATATNVTTFPTSYAASASNQVWWMKEVMTFVGLIGFFLFIIPFALLLMETKFFKPLLAETEVPSKEMPEYKKGKIIYWSGFGLTILFSFLGFLFVTRWVSGDLAVAISISKFFNQPTTNELIGWAVYSAIIVVGIMVGSYFLNKSFKKEVMETDLLSDWGIRISKNNILKTILLALATVATAYVIVFAVDYFYNSDFRVWTIAVKVFESYHVWTALKYVLFFMIFFVASSLAINASLARSNHKEWFNILLAILANAGGVLLVVILQYVGFRITGVGTFSNQSLRPILGFALIPLLSVSAVYARILYRKTGNIWLGAIINGLLITIITVANTATYLV